MSKAIYYEAKAVEALAEVKLLFGDRIDETKCLDNVPPKAVCNATTAIDFTSNEWDTIHDLDFQLYPQLRELSLAGSMISFTPPIHFTGNVDDLVKGRLDDHLLQYLQQTTEMSTDFFGASRSTPCLPVPGPDPVPCPPGLRFTIKPTVAVGLSELNDVVDAVSCSPSEASP